MKDHIFIDGEKVNNTIPLRSLFYGEGVFETFRYKKSAPALFDMHMSRMEQGAHFLKIPFPGKDYVRKLLNNAILESELGDAYVKICLLSGGTLAFYEPSAESQVLVIIKEYMPPKQSIRLKINSFKAISESPLRAIKSMNYLDNILARREAMGLGFEEALFLNEREEVVECSASNIFWYKEQTLFTPSEECGCLCGTTRELTLNLIDSCGIDLQQGRFLLNNLVNSDFVFVTNSLIGCVAVSEIDGSSFNTEHNSFNMIKNTLLQKLEWL